MFTGAWRSSQKSKWRVEARATSFSCTRDGLADHDLEVRESEAAHECFPETTEARGGAWHGFR